MVCVNQASYHFEQQLRLHLTGNSRVQYNIHLRADSPVGVSISHFFFFSSTTQNTLFVHTAAGREAGSLQYAVISDFCQFPLNPFQFSLLLLLLPLLFCWRFQVAVGLDSIGHAEEQGGITAELDERRYLHRRHHLVRDLCTGRTIQAGLGCYQASESRGVDPSVIFLRTAPQMSKSLEPGAAE